MHDSMDLVRRDGNVIIRAPLRTGLPRIKRFVSQRQEWVLGCLERTKEYREQKPLSAADRIDKFYTFNRKNEEFQQLLNREYEKVKSGNYI